jgi:hypothetical protein
VTQGLEPLVLATLVDLDSDECDLEWILDTVREACPDAEYDVLKRTVLGIVSEIVSRGLAEVHLLDGAPSAVTPAETLDQVRRRWDLLGDQLRMGDVAYLSITPAGRAEARSSSQP